MAFTHTKNVDIETFIQARIRIGSGPRRPDPIKKVRIRPDPDSDLQHGEQDDMR
jgi:hypothetical protein